MSDFLRSYIIYQHGSCPSLILSWEVFSFSMSLRWRNHNVMSKATLSMRFKLRPVLGTTSYGQRPCNHVSTVSPGKPSRSRGRGGELMFVWQKLIVPASWQWICRIMTLNFNLNNASGTSLGQQNLKRENITDRRPNFDSQMSLETHPAGYSLNQSAHH